MTNTPFRTSSRPRLELLVDARDAGFTLLEILVVITIIGLLIGLVAPAALRQLSGARVSVAKQSVERLSTILDLYDLDMGSYPTTEQGLAALVKRPAGGENWNGPYLKGDLYRSIPGAVLMSTEAPPSAHNTITIFALAAQMESKVRPP